MPRTTREVVDIMSNHADGDEAVADVGHTPRVLMQGRKKSRRRTPTRIPLYSY
jgi:hypothetical protein